MISILLATKRDLRKANPFVKVVEFVSSKAELDLSAFLSVMLPHRLDHK